MGKPNGNKSCKELHQPRCEGAVDVHQKNQLLNPLPFVLSQKILFSEYKPIP
jgi:hypothetical protein